MQAANEPLNGRCLSSSRVPKDQEVLPLNLGLAYLEFASHVLKMLLDAIVPSDVVPAVYYADVHSQFSMPFSCARRSAIALSASRSSSVRPPASPASPASL